MGKKELSEVCRLGDHAFFENDMMPGIEYNNEPETVNTRFISYTEDHALIINRYCEGRFE